MSRARVDPLRLIAEMAAIVFGILLAFALDAWWDGRQQGEWEQRQLQSLRSEFAENLVELENVITSHEGQQRDLESLISQTESHIGETVSLEASELVAVIGWRTSDLAMGALGTLLSSG